MKQPKITLTHHGKTPQSVTVEVTPEMMKLAQEGAQITGASVEQILVWCFQEAAASVRSWITDGTLQDNAHEPRMIETKRAA